MVSSDGTSLAVMCMVLPWTSVWSRMPGLTWAPGNTSDAPRSPLALGKHRGVQVETALASPTVLGL